MRPLRLPLLSLLLAASVLAPIAAFRPLVRRAAVHRRGLTPRMADASDAESLQQRVAMEAGVEAMAPEDTVCLECEQAVAAASLKRDRGLAAASAVLAAAAFFFQRANPVSAEALLHQMEADSPTLTRALANGKPTVVDVYADWCSNCKALAPATRLLEREFGDQVNWVTVRGDADEETNRAIIRALGVDAIPHYAFIRPNGVVETSLVGQVPARVLREDVAALAEERSVPYIMYDAYKEAASHRIQDYLGDDFFKEAASPK